MKINRNDWEDYDPYDDDEKFIKRFPLKEEVKSVKKKNDLIRQKRKQKTKERSESSQNAD